MVDAALDLLRERGVQPSAQEIADRAGVSLRTVFRHYDDMDSLLATAIERQVQRVGHLFQPLGPMDVASFVARRAELFEEISGARRAAMQNEARQIVRDGLAHAHRMLRVQVEGAFEISGITLDAVDAATSWWAWYALRFQQELSIEDASEVMAHTVGRLLGER